MTLSHDYDGELDWLSLEKAPGPALSHAECVALRMWLRQVAGRLAALHGDDPDVLASQTQTVVCLLDEYAMYLKSYLRIEGHDIELKRAADARPG
ncbi:hypothetical protein Pla123a_20450 [Posidoniimonas polymericola]|uniref:Uncharacterized protein n=1 Tax=Posidoniimonas polymericola TaxID=2528002 RepID=A0A5C5YR19_9BACT|nr:hypothetical protein [Posidoniimonas polymericola]TWT77384.1 hypothetical protein Pla123a_20450 [Posidoniimonas polymericola]